MQTSLPINTQTVAAMIKDHCHQYIMPLHKNLSAEQIHKKSNGQDVVTDADEAMEKHLSQSLQQILPNSLVLGEENYAKDPTIADILTSDKFIWIMDPLDGTRNFIEGRKEFCSMLSLIKSANVIAAWIYLPLDNLTLIADHLNGAYDHNNTPIKVQSEKHTRIKSQNMIGQMNFGLFDENIRHKKRTQAEQTYKNLDRIFCAGYDFSGMCRNLRHFSAYRHLWWWDHIAGTFLLQQAGGIVKQIGDESYSPIQPARHLVAAVTQDIADEITAFIQSPNPPPNPPPNSPE